MNARRKHVDFRFRRLGDVMRGDIGDVDISRDIHGEVPRFPQDIFGRSRIDGNLHQERSCR